MHLLSHIKGIREDEGGTDLLLRVEDKVKERIARRRIKSVEIRLDDGRTISAEQRKKLYATIRDIAEWQGDLPEYTKELLKYTYCEKTGEEYFSLSSCSMDLAREFISHVLDFAIEHGIPLSDTGINRTDDINRYLFTCIKYRTCVVTGRPGADIHHVTGSRVGMGRDRKSIDHSKLEIIALSREIHSYVHQKGEAGLFEKYKIFGITVDRDTLKSLGLSAGDIS